MIYEPRGDSFLILKHIKRYSRGKILNMGSGSGILAEEAGKYGNVLCADLDDESRKFLMKKGMKVVKTDLFENVKGRFDLIIFNPPYLPEDSDEDEKSKKITTGGKNGYELIERFFSEARDYLNENGRILVVFSSLTGNVFSIIKKNDFRFEILEKKKLFFEELVVCVCW